VKHRDVDHGVEETGLGSYTPKIEAAPKAVADAKHRSWEAAVASAIEEINNGIPTTADILRPPEGGLSAQRTTRRSQLETTQAPPRPVLLQDTLRPATALPVRGV
jgi:hypothetical protein